MPELNHSNHVGLGHALVGSELRLRVLAEQIVGTAWGATTGIVTLDLAGGHAFLREMTGNITELTFDNIPSGSTSVASWILALRIDSVGGYSFDSTETLTWIDGRGWPDLNLAPNAVNLVTFWRVGATTYAALAWNDDLALDPYKACFVDGQEGTIVILTESEEIDAANVTKHGTGTITLWKGSDATPITTRTAFDAGNRLGVALSSAMGETVTVRIPRYAR